MQLLTSCEMPHKIFTALKLCFAFVTTIRMWALERRRPLAARFNPSPSFMGLDWRQ